MIIDQMVGKQLVSLQSSWQTVGQHLAMMTKKFRPCSTMLANSWAVFGNVGKQLGSFLSDKLEPNHPFDVQKNRKKTEKERQKGKN